jgi:hypothetical protein
MKLEEQPRVHAGVWGCVIEPRLSSMRHGSKDRGSARHPGEIAGELQSCKPRLIIERQDLSRTRNIQGFGASDCKCGIARDRRRSKTANCLTAICGWALQSTLELASIWRVQSSVSCNRDVPKPCMLALETTLRDLF